MKRVFVLGGALCGLFAAHLQALPNSVNADDFFRETSSDLEKLPADQLYPTGRQFLFSFFSIGGGNAEDAHAALPDEELNRRFAEYKALNIPFFGPQYEWNKRALADAEKHDLKALYTVGVEMHFHKHGETLKLTQEEIFQQVSEQVKAAADSKHIALWYLQPEELRPWRKNEMDYLEAASKAIRASDPLKRPIWHYDPAHANAGRMKSIAPWVDFVGKGMYTNYASMKDSRIWCRWTIEQQIEAIKLADSSAVPIAVPDMFQQPAEEELEKIPVWVRHDNYLALVSGAKGIVVFSARQRPGFTAHEAYFNEYVKLASELRGEKKLGDVFLFGERRNDLLVEVTDGATEVELLYPNGGVKEAI